MSIRVYCIKSKSKKEYLVSLDWIRLKGQVPVGYQMTYSDKPKYFTAILLNKLIQRIIMENLGNQLDNFEIEAFVTLDPMPIKGTLKMPTLRKNAEAKVIVERLKSFP